MLKSLQRLFGILDQAEIETEPPVVVGVVAGGIARAEQVVDDQNRIKSDVLGCVLEDPDRLFGRQNVERILGMVLVEERELVPQHLRHGAVPARIDQKDMKSRDVWGDRFQMFPRSEDECAFWGSDS